MLWARCEDGLLFVSDCDASVWFVDMDMHSLFPPCFEPSVMALDPLSGVNYSTKSECIAGGGEAPVSVQGRLKNCVSFWENTLEASDFVLGIIKNGYRLPFIRFPPSVCMRNHRSAFESMDFVTNSIQELIETNCVVESDLCPLVCSPLQVVTNAKGKQRLVIDLRYINQYLNQYKFKYEGLNVVASLFHQGDYMFTFDLKSGYHHVDINVDSWPYLGFSWQNLGERRRYFMFRVLPFGLSTACYVFTKLLRPLVKYWRSKGKRIVIYIDDGICASSTLQEAESDSAMVASDLDDAGFVLNVPKSKLSPHQVGDWLGFIVDLLSGCFRVPGEKIDRLKKSIASMLQVSRLPVRAVASIVGQIMSMSLALGPIARLRTRSMYTDINSCPSWHSYLYLSRESLDELDFWCKNIVQYNGQPIWFKSGATRVVYSDASDRGYGGYSVELGPEVAHGNWSKEEAIQSSTWRELKAVYQVLCSLASKLRGHTVKWYSDNQNVTRIVLAGSRKQHLQEGAMAIFEVCFQNGIKLEMEWVPRAQNQLADYISRIQDFDDWKIDPNLFLFFDFSWGPHTVDCFASSSNCQLARFHSRFWCPGTEAVDSFTVNWEGETCWLAPPLYLICRALRHAETCKARGTLVVPMWKSAVFWPLLCPDGVHLAHFIHAWYAQPYYEGAILASCSGGNLGDSLTYDSILLFVYFDFTQPPRISHIDFCLTDEGFCSTCISM